MTGIMIKKIGISLHLGVPIEVGLQIILASKASLRTGVTAVISDCQRTLNDGCVVAAVLLMTGHIHVIQGTDVNGVTLVLETDGVTVTRMADVGVHPMVVQTAMIIGVLPITGGRSNRRSSSDSCCQGDSWDRSHRQPHCDRHSQYSQSSM